MALIMFWGMFGFGEMVSYISFMGHGGVGWGRGGGGFFDTWAIAGCAVLRNFTLGVFRLRLWACFITVQCELHLSAVVYNIFVLSFMMVF